MKIPELPCNIEVFCPINPSEDVQKIEEAIINIFPDIKITKNSEEISAISKKIEPSIGLGMAVIFVNGICRQCASSLVIYFTY